jgi:HlyD family secretion protein
MAASRRFPLGLLITLLVVGGGLAWLLLGPLRKSGSDDAPALSTVTRGPLRVTVLESGSLEALASTTIVSPVEGQAVILFLVEEGTVVSPEDVAAGRILVKLDSSELEEKVARQLIDLEAARAAAVNAASTLDIQRQEDASKERQAILQVEFARMDLQRAVGVEIAARLEALRRKVDAGTAPLAELETAIRSVLADDALRGETLQKLRQLSSDISLADEELKRAQVKWDWSKKLLEKDFVSRDEEDADRLAFERRKIEKERAETAHTQFATYDYPKVATKLLSDVLEAEGELARVRDRARAAQERGAAELKAKREQEGLQQKRYDKYRSQRDACIIKAPRAGLVLYASSTGGRGYDESQRIKEGATIRERQPIITMPDMNQMGARVNIHESVIDRVQKGQRVTVSVDAAPDQPLDGTVDSVKDVPNDADRWMNPDLKVYTTMIRLAGEQSALRPGMSVKVEILVREIPDALSVPVQAVAGAMGRPAVWVWDGSGSRERLVTIGATNDRFVQVLSGVSEGERVLLAPPRAAPGSTTPGSATPSGPPRPAGEAARPAATPRREAPAAGDGATPATERPSNGGARPRGPRGPARDGERAPR